VPYHLATEADAAASYFTGKGYPINGDSQIVVAIQSGTCPQGFACGGSGSYCAWHSAFSEGSLSNVPFTNLPFLLDAGPRARRTPASELLVPGACENGGKVQGRRPRSGELGTYYGCAARARKKSSIRPIASLNWSASIGLTM
jgi:hypothetical protein